MPVFPDVPNDPGVPPVLRDLANFSPTETVLLIADTVLGFGSGLSPQWGVYQGGEAVIVADTVVELSFKREWALADYPVERGGFESYDKVDIPFDVRVRFAAGGSEENRQALLDSIDAIAGDLNLYDVVTPEKVYLSVNVQHYDYKRTSTNGLGLLTVDVWLLEVRTSANDGGAPSQPGSGSGNTQDPSGAPDQNGGSVQPSSDVAPTQSNVSAFDSGATSIPFFVGPGAGPLAPNTGPANVLPVQ